MRTLGWDKHASGGALLKLWEIPSSFVEPVAFQYEPRLSKDEPLLACILYVAKWLRDAAHLSETRSFPPLPAPWIMNMLQLAPGSLEVRLYQVRTGYLEAAKTSPARGPRFLSRAGATCASLGGPCPANATTTSSA